MPKFICKLGGKYLEWSTIVDAPTTYGMTLEEFKQYYKEQYGLSSMNELEERLRRVEQKGTSSQIDDSVEDLIRGNRAGKDEKELTMKQLIKEYCLRVEKH